MKAFPFDVVVFDLDGTLADTAPDIAAALNHVLGEFGRDQLSMEAIRDMVGHGTRVLLRRGLAATGDATEELIDRAEPIYLDFYAANVCNGTTAYVGVDATLQALHTQGARLAICTNKPERLSHLLLDALGWDERFDAVIGADSLAVRKPDPATFHAAVARAGGGRAVMIGDSITDGDTARAAQVPFVAVSFGFRDRPASELGADAVIDDYAELIPVLERL
jgi:phosphoglycolate phosphatase